MKTFMLRVMLIGISIAVLGVAACLVLDRIARGQEAAVASDPSETPTTKTLWATIPQADEAAWLKDAASVKTPRIYETDGDSYTRQDATAVVAQDWHPIGSQLELDEKTPDTLYRATVYKIRPPVATPVGDAKLVLWTVIPASLIPAWLANSQDPKIAAQITCYETGDVVNRAVDPATAHATGVGWIKTWEQTPPKGESVYGFQAAQYDTPTYLDGGK